MNSKSTVTATTKSTRRFVCEFCDTPFVNKSNLDNHLKNTKYCRRIRDRDTEEIPCENCDSNKDLAVRARNQEKQLGDLKLELTRRDRKISLCEDRIVSLEAELKDYMHIVVDQEDKIESLKADDNQIKLDNVALEREITSLKVKILRMGYDAQTQKNLHEIANRDLTKLKEKLAIMDKANQELTLANTELRVSLEYMTSERDNAVKIRHIKQEYYQNMKPVNLEEENISYQVYNFKKKDKVDCPKGVAHALVKYLLTDDDDNLVYMCTDVDNRKFNYKDKTGVIRGDFEAKMLLEKVRPWIDNYTRKFYKQTLSDSDEEELVKQLAIMTRETDIIERLALVQ